MFENICTLPLSSDLFAQAVHPTQPIVAVGLASGHVQSFRLPPVAGSSPDDEDGDGNTSVLSTGTSTIDIEWRTHRHKGSCRTLTYSGDGEFLYSAGTDGILKVASSLTGRVVSKILTPFDSSSKSADPATILHALSPQTLLLSTDSAALHLYDLRTPSSFTTGKPSQTHHPHDDFISSLTPLQPTETSTSGFSKQWVSTGGTTLAVTDLRRGVMVKSEDQEDELLSSVYIDGIRSKSKKSSGKRLLVGSAVGVLTMWERGVWDDQDGRIIVDAGERGAGGGDSLDSLAVMPEGVGNGCKNVVVGLGNGTIKIAQLGLNQVVGDTLKHHDIEPVVALDFDVEGRLISGGGSIVKVWQEEMAWDEDSDEDEEDSDDEIVVVPSKKRAMDGSDSDDSDDEQDNSDEERSKKRQKGKKAKAKLANHGILKLQGLE
ncbi:WD repeat-containing protein jip5 [Amylocarpus encephaloides]|uniref:WD repeat-containing protein JIP5 n=1 Tax=Amylocarpus encephaloides TaxID=45428 RepID=A0A9P7YQW7_9HELO|nr:WD repeat-containing protein jip5 [Amylocarpus encephaloides]